MRRSRKAAVAALAALAIGISVSGGSGSAPRRLAYVTGGAAGLPEVWLARADGSHARVLGPGAHPLLSPDGSIVAASSPAPRGPALTLFSASGGSARRFFSAAATTARAEAFSPDSHFLAIVLASTNPGSDATSGLAVIDTRSGAARIVARGSIYGASFAPGESDRIAYASARGVSLSARVDVRVAGADGRGERLLTHDGASLNPVWGSTGIAFDEQLLRSRAAPAYQVWTMRADGTGRRRLTDVRVPPLLDGLVPLGFSGDGTRLLAEYEGQDTSQAWAIEVSSGRARELRIGGHAVAGGAISRDGRTVLVDHGGFLNLPGEGVVESIAFTGGAPRVLVAHGAQPSWSF